MLKKLKVISVWNWFFKNAWLFLVDVYYQSDSCDGYVDDSFVVKYAYDCETVIVGNEVSYVYIVDEPVYSLKFFGRDDADCTGDALYAFNNIFLDTCSNSNFPNHGSVNLTQLDDGLYNGKFFLKFNDLESFSRFLPRIPKL